MSWEKGTKNSSKPFAKAKAFHLHTDVATSGIWNPHWLLTYNGWSLWVMWFLNHCSEYYSKHHLWNTCTILYQEIGKNQHVLKYYYFSFIYLKNKIDINYICNKCNFFFLTDTADWFSFLKEEICGSVEKWHPWT